MTTELRCVNKEHEMGVAFNTEPEHVRTVGELRAFLARYKNNCPIQGLGAAPLEITYYQLRAEQPGTEPGGYLVLRSLPTSDQKEEDERVQFARKKLQDVVIELFQYNKDDYWRAEQFEQEVFTWLDEVLKHWLKVNQKG